MENCILLIAMYCSSCGQRVQPSDNNCDWCNAQLKNGVSMGKEGRRRRPLFSRLDVDVGLMDRLPPLPPQNLPGGSKEGQLYTPVPSQTWPGASRVHVQLELDKLPALPSQTVPGAIRVRVEPDLDKLPALPSKTVRIQSPALGASSSGNQKERPPERSPYPVFQTVPNVDRSRVEMVNRNRWTKSKREVSCKTKIQYGDIARFIRKHHDSLTDKDRTLLQGAMNLFTNTAGFVWEDAQLTVYCPTVQPVFYSGNRSNQYELYLKTNRPTHDVVNKEIRLTMPDGTTAFLTFIIKAVTAIDRSNRL